MSLSFSDLDPGDIAVIQMRSAGFGGAPAMVAAVLVLRFLNDAEVAAQAALGGMSAFTGPAIWGLAIGSGSVVTGAQAFSATDPVVDTGGMVLLARFRPERAHAEAEEAVIAALLPSEV